MNINSISYTLYKEDFLAYQLFVASKSKNIKRNRLKSRLIISILYICLSIFELLIRKSHIALILLFFGIIWFLFYPIYSKIKYKKHYMKHIEENYKNRIGILSSIKINADIIELKDISTESKLQISDIVQINEIQDYYFIQLKQDSSIILPKRIENIKEFINVLNKEYKIEIVAEVNWKWK